MMKKEFVVSIICFIMLTSLPFASSTNVKIPNEKEIIRDEPHLDVCLPDAHIYLYLNRFKWGTVEFDEPGAIIDVNLSGFEEDYPLVGFYQHIHCHVKGQLLFSWFLWNIDCGSVGEMVSGGGIAAVVGILGNWTYNATLRFIRIDKEKEGYFPISLELTGAPRGFSVLWRIIFMLEIFDIHDKFNFPWIEKNKETVEYQLYVHT